MPTSTQTTAAASQPVVISEPMPAAAAAAAAETPGDGMLKNDLQMGKYDYSKENIKNVNVDSKC